MYVWGMWEYVPLRKLPIVVVLNGSWELQSTLPLFLIHVLSARLKMAIVSGCRKFHQHRLNCYLSKVMHITICSARNNCKMKMFFLLVQHPAAPLAMLLTAASHQSSTRIGTWWLPWYHQALHYKTSSFGLASLIRITRNKIVSHRKAYHILFPFNLSKPPLPWWLTNRNIRRRNTMQQ